ncbi:MAG TPA: hypothetical protein VLM76_10630 [Patescibacteria group bacterium]|nr:hypothetical protein [Patescibacteria group bacterium]
MTLLSIPEEAALCRAAFAAVPDATHAAHVHHSRSPVERLYDPVERRIAYILDSKPEHEQAIRLHCLRPLTAEQWAAWEVATTGTRAAWEVATTAAWATYNATIRAAHDAICPVTDCPWDGRTIFGGTP